MPTSRIFSRNIDLKGYQVKNFVFNPMTTSARTALSLSTGDEGYAVFDTDENSPFYWDGTQWITWPGGSGGSGNAINITYSAFQSLTGGSTTIPYYITDVGKEGFFYYTGTVADQSTDNGGTIIVTSDLKQYRRSYSGDIQITWFGALTGSGNATATTAAINAAKTAAKSLERIYLGAGDWYINSTITFTNTSTKRNNIYIEGNIFSTHLGDAFVMEGNFPGSFVCKGKISGPNPTATDEAGYSAYVGSGVRMKNLYNSYIEVNEVVFFREGLHMTGEGPDGGTFNGSQYNRIYFNFLYQNYIQIKISTYGDSATNGYFANESFWYGGQLGRGVPYVDYGKNGWYGLVAVKDPSNPVPATAYGIGGHMFHHVNFEGLENGLVLDNCIFMKFLGCSWEEGGMHQHISLSEGNCESAAFDSNCVIHEKFFVTGRRGIRTTIDSPYWNADVSNPSVQVPIGNTATSLATVSGTTGTFLVSSDYYTGFTAWNLPGPELWTKRAQFPTVSAGMNKIGGVIRNFAYKGTYRNIDSSVVDATVTLPANIAYVRYNPTAPKTLIIQADDLVGNFWQSFEIEILTTTHGLTIVRGDTSATIFSPSDFPSIGRYKIDFRSNGFVKIRMDNTSSTALSLTTIGSSPNANGATLTGGVLNLQPANASFGGVLTTIAQEIAGVKTFKDNVVVNKATPAALTVETTSATETDTVSIDAISVTSAAQIRVSNATALQLGRKDNTTTSFVTFGNGKTFGTGKLWSVGLKAGNNFHIVNDGTTNTAISIQAANGNVRIGANTSDPGVNFQVDGSSAFTGTMFLPGLGSSIPSGEQRMLIITGTGGAVSSTTIPSGGGGGGISTLNTLTGATQTFAVGSSGSDFNISSSSTTHTFNIPSASSSARGLITTGTQTIGSVVPHTKTFNGTVLLGKVGDTAANTAPLKFAAGVNLMSVPEVNSVEYYDNSLWLTNTLATRSKILTGDNVAILTNKTWQSTTIGIAYGGTGATTANAAFNALAPSQTSNSGKFLTTNGTNTSWADIPGQDATFNSGTVSVVLGPGAGTTGATVNVPVSNNRVGDIRIVPGSSPSTNAVICTVTTSTTIPFGAIVTISPNNSVSATKAGVYAQITGTNTFTINSTTTALQTGASHIWGYTITYP